ncbi:MAG: phosphomannomutase [Kiritimatiellae bacterium]|nr:phosphomannomutase [Kiritimatiellia bacterium]
MKKGKVLKFGTSGLRDTVEAMTDQECYINTRGFLAFLEDRNELMCGGAVAIGGDRRSSTPRIMAAVRQAVRDSGYIPQMCGRVPSPALVYYALKQDIPSIMVTGSHIPDDRNGIKFTKKSGEVLKSDEADILLHVALQRDLEYKRMPSETCFDATGMFREKHTQDDTAFEAEVMDLYIYRYLDVFPSDSLAGLRVVVYQHSAVGRDILTEILRGLGAEVISIGRSEQFVPVDTEKISEATRRLLTEAAEEYHPFAIVSTDGDSDRPLLADERGNFLPGDKLGALVSIFLEPDFAAIPISANDAVVKALRARTIEVRQTKIGSPYVISAMNEAREKDPSRKVVSWESNGGFLLGSDWPIGDKILSALPTRDAVLPLLATLLLALRNGQSLSLLIESALPAWCTSANVVDNETPGCGAYTADLGRRIIAQFSPQDPGITQVDFASPDDHLDAAAARIRPTNETARKAVDPIRQSLQKYFPPGDGFGMIVGLNFIDGIRILFDDERVVHLRPSGNAPEFRMYAAAARQEEADSLVNKRREIISRMVADITAS